MKKNFTKKDVEIIIDLYVNQMKSIDEISNKFNCGAKPIRRILIENNVKFSKVSAYNYKYWMDRGMSIDEAREQVKKIRPTNIEYWLNMGYDLYEAKKELLKQRLINEEGFILKYGEKEGRERWKHRNEINSKNAKLNLKSSLEYWKNLGYENESEINLLISSRQSTFSREKCIEKYGIDEGIKIWENRQIKWQKTLSGKPNINEINKNKDSKGVSYFKRKYGDEWLKHLIMKRGYVNESIEYINDCVTNSNTYEDLIDYITNNYEYVDYYNFSYRLCRKIFCEIYDVEYEKLKKDVLKKYGYENNSIFGHKREYGGFTFNSVGEWYIGKYLIDSGISFKYDSKYSKDSNYRYDFYLCDYEMYFEYTGMLINGNVNEYANQYEKRLSNKINYCNDNNLIVFVSCDYNEIINRINMLINEEKN